MKKSFIAALFLSCAPFATAFAQAPASPTTASFPLKNIPTVNEFGEVGVIMEDGKKEKEFQFNGVQEPTTGIFSFNFKNPQINLDEIKDGGVVPNGIPALINPLFTPAKDYFKLFPNDYVIGLEVNGEVKGYPLRILNWHGGVNDIVGGKKIFIAWDPLASMSTVFERDMYEGEMAFSTSGMVYRSSTLYYDQGTNTLWSPLLGKAVAGDLSGRETKTVPHFLTQYENFQKHYPSAQIMTFNTGFNKDYTKNPYLKYATSHQTPFPTAFPNKSLRAKEMVFGVTLENRHHKIAIAFPMEALLSQTAGKDFHFAFNAHKGPNSEKFPLMISKGNVEGQINAHTQKGVTIRTFYSYWFVWNSIYPETLLIQKMPNTVGGIKE